MEQKSPIILTSEPARQKYEENLLKLQKMEMQYMPNPMMEEKPKPKTNQNFK